MRRHHDVDTPEWLLKMQHEGHHSHRQQCQRENQRKARNIFQLLNAEDVIEGGKYEGSRYQAGHKGIHDDLDRPVDVFVGVDKKFFQGPDLTVYHGYFTSIEDPR